MTANDTRCIGLMLIITNCLDLRWEGLAALLGAHSLHARPPEVHAQGFRGRRRVLQRPDGRPVGDEPAPADGPPQGVLPRPPRQVPVPGFDPANRS